jgi:ATP-dependent DNA helicase RecQ
MSKSIEGLLKQYWGYKSFLPSQKEAIQAICAGRDTAVVLPTGGGKSLCFQLPALVLQGLTLVISPLISLMKDQVDALLQSGIAGARIDSSMSQPERTEVFARLQAHQVKILYVSPERVVSSGFLDFAQTLGISSVAIDEAHCVSMWGHDFRPEYRQLSIVRQVLPGVPIGAYTATATERVRRDMCQQLQLRDPLLLVGRFDRPNLHFRLEPRWDLLGQLRPVLQRHHGQSGIIYCIRRKDVDELSEELQDLGFRALPYHAGMEDCDRKRNQEAFITGKADIVVATVAFGMGIDKPNVRYVIHAGMPKSIEHYQQETGRAGRDGLKAECPLFYSTADYMSWRWILENSESRNALDIHLQKLDEMYLFCTQRECRHRAVSRYFGQELGSNNCGACDICLSASRRPFLKRPWRIEPGFRFS